VLTASGGHVRIDAPSCNYREKRLACEDSTIKDASQVKNVISTYFWGVKRSSYTRKYKYPPMLFFHEMDETKLQQYAHLLIPELPNKFNSKGVLEDEWNGYVKGAESGSPDGKIIT
jgi:hypothetical protein